MKIQNFARARSSKFAKCLTAFRGYLRVQGRSRMDVVNTQNKRSTLTELERTKPATSSNKSRPSGQQSYNQDIRFRPIFPTMILKRKTDFLYKLFINICIFKKKKKISYSCSIYVIYNNIQKRLINSNSFSEINEYTQIIILITIFISF